MSKSQLLAFNDEQFVKDFNKAQLFYVHATNSGANVPVSKREVVIIAEAKKVQYELHQADFDKRVYFMVVH